MEAHAFTGCGKIRPRVAPSSPLLAWEYRWAKLWKPTPSQAAEKFARGWPLQARCWLGSIGGQNCGSPRLHRPRKNSPVRGPFNPLLAWQYRWAKLWKPTPSGVGNCGPAGCAFRRRGLAGCATVFPSMEKRTFFVTSVTWQHRPILQSDELARELLSTLLQCRAEGRFALHEFVIMPDHLHLILTPATALSLERAMQFVKGGFSYRVGKLRPNLMVWEKSFTNHRIRDERDYAQHREYIHHNPVRRHLALAASEFPYSSAHPGFDLDPSPFTAAKAASDSMP